MPSVFKSHRLRCRKHNLSGDNSISSVLEAVFGVVVVRGANLDFLCLKGFWQVYFLNVSPDCPAKSPSASAVLVVYTRMRGVVVKLTSVYDANLC